ncbi:dihydrolipoyl dehydrogenase [Fictibacillus aquaticus]|uniref:Dihydrolipoyl dehydrogenase n=1 Tax=Fictibacillus aquaticus TaxID=2021314 RepID=A0A235FE61_9BACL|nr:dihydrolipoyl dehydrogenase [Fictibacillus aquaticus]OYD59666.1 dihydrolipoyl dehydrogenase [Fictibacillus aquaticus]
MVVGDFATKKQLIIIGGGPGGYHAAIRAAQLGLEVMIIEKEKVGGVCLHKGCIPSKALTHAASSFSQLSHMKDIGIETGETSFSLEAFGSYQTSVVSGLQKGVEALIKANKIELVSGTASFISENRIGVDSGHHFEMYEFENVLIATGSAPILPDGVRLSKRIFSSHTVWSLSDLPQHLIVYGNDYFALEAAASFRQLGSEVTLITPEDGFGFDNSIEKELLRVMKKSKVKILRNHAWSSVEEGESTVTLSLNNGKGDIAAVEGTHLLISAGYRPNVESLGVEVLNLDRDDRGYLIVNGQSQTSVKNIYAAGDCTIGPMLASKAIKQAKVAAEHMTGVNSEYNLAFVPQIVHTIPPIAAAGLSEDEARAQGLEVKTGQFAMGGNGYASIIGQKEGIVKVIIDAETDVLLGVHMIGAGAAEMIHSAVTSLELVAREEDITYPIYAHPALNESWLEAAESLSGKAIHIAPAKKRDMSKV